MNLENLNVVELNAHEMQNTDGGLVPLVVWVAVAFFAGTAAAHKKKYSCLINSESIPLIK